MGATVGELQARMTSREFLEWMVYWSLEPFGPVMEDVRAGVVAATVANVYRDQKKRRRPYTPADFLPWLEDGLEGTRPRAQPTAGELYRRFRTWAILAGARPRSD